MHLGSRMRVPLFPASWTTRQTFLMKTLQSLLFSAAFTAFGSAATTIYLQPTDFFNSSAWSNAASGAVFTENFVASGGLHNFTGNEQFTSNAYTYGSGELANTMTVSRQDGVFFPNNNPQDTQGLILVDTSNEAGGFLSYDSPGSSKYLYMPSNYLGETMTISFSKPISAFAFRLGDFGDPGLSGGVKLYSGLEITSRNTAVAGSLDTLVWDNHVRVSDLGARLNLYESTGVAGYTPVTIGDDQWAFLSWTFDSPVNEIKISNFQSSDDSWGVDTISFATTTAVVNQTSAVPEPAAVIALTGLLGSAAFLRRRSA